MGRCSRTVAGLGLLGLVGLLPATPGTAQEPSVLVSVDRNEISLEEQVRMQVQVEGAQAIPQLPELPDFRVVPSGQGRQMRLVNGRTSASFTFDYLLIPQRTGRFQVGPVTVEVDGKSYQSRPFTLSVLAESSAPSRQARDVFLTVSVSDRQPYVGEHILYTWRFYRRVAVSDARLVSMDFGGLSVEELGDVREYQTTLDGVQYVVSELRRALFAQRAGEFEIPASELTCRVAVDGSRQRSIFDFGRVSMEPRTLRTQVLELEVEPLPPSPPGYSGLVGEFKIGAQLGQRQLAVGESTTLSVTISGEGNVQMMQAPTLPALDAFKVYRDQPSISIDRSNDRLRGTAVYRTALVPLRAGKHQIPPLPLVTFDPERGAYLTLTTPALELEVLEGEGEELMLTESVTPTTGKVAVRILAEDILPIRREVEAAAPPPLQGWRGWAWALLGLVPPLGLILWLAVERWWPGLGAAESPRRRRQLALRRGLARLGELDGAGAPADPKAVASLAAGALRSYVRDRLGGEGIASTPAEVESQLRELGIDVPLARRARELLERLEAAQYGASGSGLDRASVARSLGTMLRDLDRHIERAVLAGGSLASQATSRRAGRWRHLCWVLVLSPGLPGGGPLEAQEEAQGQVPALQATADDQRDPVEIFVGANQAYDEGRYSAAIELYGHVLAAERTRPEIHYNLGNAYLRNGEIGRAIASYRRAQRQDPRDQDTTANLEFARSLRRDALLPPEASPFARALFFWHFSLSRSEAARAAAVSSALCCVALMLLRRRPQLELARWSAAVFGLVLLGLLASLALRWLAPERLAVVLAQEVEARSGNDPATVVRFVLHSGAEVRTLETRDEWVRVVLPDGEQGWLPAEHVEIVTL